MERILRASMALWRDERGVALILALMALVVMAALSASLLTIGRSEVQITSNLLSGTQALFAAEAGAERGIAQFVATGTLVNENSGIFQGWRMQGAGEWRFSGGPTPPNGTYYASDEIEIRASPGTVANPWQATFIAGASGEEGEVEIEGHPNIVPYLDDLPVTPSAAFAQERGYQWGSDYPGDREPRLTVRPVICQQWLVRWGATAWDSNPSKEAGG